MIQNAAILDHGKTNQQWLRLMPFLLRFVVSAALLSLAAYHYGNDLARLLLPAFQLEIEHLDDTYQVVGMSVDQDGADAAIRLQVRQARYIVLNGRAHYPDPRGKATVSTLVGHVTLPAVLIAALALAWPLPARRKWAGIIKRAVLIAPALVFLWALDVPFVLWATVWNIHVQAYSPGLFSPLLIWNEFLEGGGRLALAGALGFLVAALGS